MYTRKVNHKDVEEWYENTDDCKFVQSTAHAAVKSGNLECIAFVPSNSMIRTLREIGPMPSVRNVFTAKSACSECHCDLMGAKIKAQLFPNAKYIN
jgi:hypothetical protein